MIITKNDNFRKAATNYSLRLTEQEGFYIRYCLKKIGWVPSDISRNLNVSPVAVHYVVAGRRRSRKVEAEIARILGKPSWNDLVIEARLFVSNPAFRPTQKDIDEYKNVLTLKLKEIENRKAKMREELAPMREAVQAIRRGR